MALQYYLATINPSTEVYLHSYPSVNLPGSQTAYSFMAWLNTGTTVAGTPTQSMIGMYDGTNDAATVPTTGIQIGTGQSANAGAIDCWTFGGTVLVSTFGNGVGFTAAINTWYHVVYTCSAISGGSMTHNIYVNGALINTATNALQTAGTYTQVYLNGFPQTTTAANGYTESSNTKIDDAAVYTRQLSLGEIQTIYTSFGQRSGDVYGCVAKYDFNELAVGSATAGARDFSGLGNNLAVVNRGGGTVPTYLADYSCLDTRPPL